MYSLLKISLYNFPDDKTGEIIKGSKITLMSLEPTTQPDTYGYDVITENISYDIAQDFIKMLPNDVKFPVNVDVGMTIDLSSKRKVKINGIRLSK